MTKQLSNDPVSRALRAYASSLRLIDPIRLRVWDERGLTMGQLRALYVLLGEGPMAASALADRLKVRPATMTGLADRLVRHGLIERHSDEGDRRLVLLALSAEGDSIMRDIEERVSSYMADILGQLTDAETKALVRSLERLAEAADEVGQEYAERSLDDRAS